MDNLTHSLIGAALGQAGLKRKTALAMPALMIAANLPDIDVPCALYGVESLEMRRGITHGPIALLLLPQVLAGLLIAWDRWQARRGTRPEGRLAVHAGWLIALCYLGTFTHPLFDWFNNYGIRLLEPFSHQWFYGDMLFIVDPWIIAMLGLGLWRSLRRERVGGWKPNQPAVLALFAISAYIVLNSVISILAVNSARLILSKSNPAILPEVIVANAKPFAFWQRDILWRTGARYGRGDYSAFGSTAVLDQDKVFVHLPPPQPGVVSFSEGSARNSMVIASFNIGMSDPRIAEWSRNDRAAKAFLFWSRMPVTELHDDYIVLRDQRFMDRRMDRQFSVTLRKPKP
ncbi:MAG: metal-dependent hydrolase [Novosphingobium sp.]